MNGWIVVVKRVAGIVLLAALFLPLSQCTLEQEHPQTKAAERTVTVTYAYTAFEHSIVDGFAAYGAFLWPLLLAAACRIWPGLSRRLSVLVLELLLCLASAYELFGLLVMKEVLYGGYLAAGAIGAYLIAVLAQLAVLAWSRWQRALPARA